MRCDMCPLCPIAEDDCCAIADDPKYGMEHKDGMMGCRHPYNWVKKKADEHAEYLGKMEEDLMRAIKEEQIQNALEKLQAQLTCGKRHFTYECYGDDCEVCEYNYAQGNVSERNEALRTAIRAMKKQISEKPIKTKEQAIRYTDSYECPNCHKGFTGTGFADYCYHCGQRLDWSVE